MTLEASEIIQDAFLAARREVPPLAPPGVERLSVSAIDRFWKCPEQFRRERYDQELAAMRASALFGRAFHRAVEVNYEAKKHTREDLDVKTMRDISGGSFTEERDKVIGKQELIWDRKENELQQAVITSVVGNSSRPGYLQTLAPTVQPVEVERWVEVPTEYGFPVVAKLDVEEERGEVIDIKTGTKRRNQTDLDNSIQGTGYLWLRAREGNPASNFTWHLAIEKKTPEYQDMTTGRTAGQMAAFERLLETTARTMRFYWEQFGPDGPWPGASESGWWCSQKACSFWKTCPWRGGAA
jgi:hypothetical protein